MARIETDKQERHERKLKIALELQPCCGQRSGIGVYTYELAKRLLDHDGLTYHGNIFNFAGRNDNSEKLRDVAMPIYENKILPYGVYRRIWGKVPISYDALFPSADVSLFFNFIVPPRISGAVITTVHDMTYMRYPETVAAKNMKRLQDGMEYSIKRSDRILTVSEFSKSEIVSCLGLPPEKIDVVYPAASITGGLCDYRSLSDRLGLTGPYVLFVGSVEPRKNLSRLLSAFELMKRRTGLAHSLLLCGGRGWNNEAIFRQLASMRFREDVIMTGYLTDAERNTLYKNAEAMVFPSVYEGFGVPPLEAMYWGTPVVCSKAASLPEAAGDAACGVDPFSVESIADGMERVLTDKGYTEWLMDRGKEQYDKYSWDKSARKLEEVIRKTMGQEQTTDDSENEAVSIPL